MQKFAVATVVFTVVALFATSPSPASTLIGNPSVTLELVAGKAVYIQSVVGWSCTSGSQTLTVAAVLDDEVEVVTFAEDELCDIDVNLRWVPGGALQAVPVTGFDTFKALSGASGVSIGIDETAHTATMY